MGSTSSVFPLPFGGPKPRSLKPFLTPGPKAGCQADFRAKQPSLSGPAPGAARDRGVTSSGRSEAALLLLVSSERFFHP